MYQLLRAKKKTESSRGSDDEAGGTEFSSSRIFMTWWLLETMVVGGVGGKDRIRDDSDTHWDNCYEHRLQCQTVWVWTLAVS